MKREPLSVNQLSIDNLKRKPFRTASLVTTVAILAFILFGGSLLSVNLKNGLNNVKARFGADLIAVPVDSQQNMGAILLKGEPDYFYFEKSVADKIAKVDGVARITPQFFLASLGTACCSQAVQIIGFDPKSDFVIRPWLTKIYEKQLRDGELIAGSAVTPEPDQTIKLYETSYPVVAQLEKTGTGLDNSVFGNMNTIRALFAGAKKIGLQFLSSTDPDHSISTVLIKTADGYDANLVARNIISKLDGIRIIKTQGVITGIAENLGSLVAIIYVLIAVLWILAVGILTVVFSITVNERKKEFAVLRILGATRKKLAAIILGESFLISASGGVIGIAAASAIVFPFSVYIGDQLGLPYLQPQVGVVLGVLALSLSLSSLVGPLASAYAAFKISKAETYLTMREGE